jgi:hypothetical protein
MLVQDENTIKLHTDKNGEIWYARGISTAVNSNQQLDTFLLSSAANGIGLTFRMLGIPENAELITSLFLRYNKGEVRSVQIAGPNMLAHPSVLENPFATISQMRAAVASPSCGGWHHVSVNDYPTYALIARMRRAQFSFDTTAETYLHLHPAYRALSFIPTLVEDRVAQLLVNIVDPRWYLNSCADTAIKKISLYCGLVPAVQKNVSNVKHLIRRGREIRCANVLASWKSVAQDAANFDAPANFLYRVWRNSGGGWRGDLRASQLFLRYTVENWLAALEKRDGVKDGLFVPSRFFKTKDERDAFAAHMTPQK